MAAVGQTREHWPHWTHSTLASFFVEGRSDQGIETSLLSLDGVDCLDICANRYTAAAEHALAGIPHNGRAGIINGIRGFSPSKRTSVIPKASASFCSSQFWLRTQVRHSIGWSERISSRISLRALITAGVLGTDNHALGNRSELQAGTKALAPCTFDNANRQAPITLISF